MPSTLYGFPSRGYSQEYGGVPSVSDPLGAMRDALAGDIGALGNIYNLTTGLSSASAAGARTQYESNLPYYGSMLTKGSQNIMENLAGQVPSDVINLLGSQAAERGYGFGPDSPASNAAYLRALGLTSIGQQNLGQQQLTAAIGRTPVGPMFNPASMIVSPEQQQEAQQAANVFAAAPVPSAAAAAAERAANRGIMAGGGAVGGGRPAGGAARGGYQFPEPGMYTGSSTSTGTQIGGVTYYGGETPASAGDAWSRWYNSIAWPGASTGGGADQQAEDTYYYTGLTPEDMSYFGLGNEDLYGAGSAGGGPVPVTDYGSGGDFWESMFEDYDPFGIMGPYEGP